MILFGLDMTMEVSLVIQYIENMVGIYQKMMIRRAMCL